MTTHTWTETPGGVWTLRVENVPGKNSDYDQGMFREWTLVLHGTRDPPYHRQEVTEDGHPKLFKVKRMHEEFLKTNESRDHNDEKPLLLMTILLLVAVKNTE